MGIDEQAYKTAFDAESDPFVKRLFRGVVEAYEAAKGAEQPDELSDVVGAIFNELARVCREAVPGSSLACLMPSHRLTIANAIAPLLKQESAASAEAMKPMCVTPEIAEGDIAELECDLCEYLSNPNNRAKYTYEAWAAEIVNKIIRPHLLRAATKEPYRRCMTHADEALEAIAWRDEQRAENASGAQRMPAAHSGDEVYIPGGKGPDNVLLDYTSNVDQIKADAEKS